MTENKTIISAKNIVKSYMIGSLETKVLRGINIEIKQKEFSVITGRSGSGKSTLLYILSLLDKPTSGEILFENCNTKTFSEKINSYCRLKHFGFVFQDYALLPELTALENVILPLMMSETKWKNIKEKGSFVLSQVELQNKLNNYPSQLSGGEKQRVAIARAIVNNPKILFADEPTANLDSKKADEIINLLFDLNKKGLTVILVTHEKKYIQRANRIIKISDGMIEEEKKLND
jgi:putative ABC transport system ATP-binding protein